MILKSVLSTYLEIFNIKFKTLETKCMSYKSGFSINSLQDTAHCTEDLPNLLLKTRQNIGIGVECGDMEGEWRGRE